MGLDISTTRRDNRTRLIQQFQLRDANVIVNSGLDGGDYVGTLIRAIPQFFFAYMLPLPLLQIAAIGYCAYAFQREAVRRRDEDVLTEEFLLAYFATAPNEGESAELRLEEKATQARIEAAIERLKKSGRREIETLRTFAMDETNRNTILARLREEVTPAVEKSSSTHWNVFFNTTLHYAAGHWVLWMVLSLAFSTDIWEGDPGKNDRHCTKDPTTLLPMFNETPAFWIEFVAPLILVLAVLRYNYQHRLKEAEAASLHKLKQQQNGIRSLYLKDNAQTRIDGPKGKSEVFSESTAVGLTRATAFLDAFLIFNLFTWPLCMFLQAMLGDQDLKPNERDPLNPDIKIPVIFVLTTLLSIFHAYRMGEEMKQAAGQEIQETYQPRQSFREYYFNNPETRSTWHVCGKEVHVPTTFTYWTVSRATGSGGILLARILFDGGILGYICHKANPDRYETASSMPHVDEMLGIALGLAAVVVTLNLYQTYYAAQRNSALKNARDRKLSSTS